MPVGSYVVDELLGQLVKAFLARRARRRRFVILGRHEVDAAECSNRMPVDSPPGEVLAMGVVAVLTRFRLGKLATFDERFQFCQPSGPSTRFGDVRV